MKDNKLVKLVAFILLITIVAISLVAGTYAKYTSSVSGEDTATVAKWSIKVNDNELAAETPTVTFDLFDTIKDSNGGTEEDVEAGLIAPGTSGTFDLVIANESEVKAKYAVAFEISGTTLPLEFSLDGQTWSSSLAPIEAEEDDYLAAKTGTKTINVQWRWAYEQTDVTTGDTADTDFGILAQGTTVPEVKVKTTLTVTQVD